MLLLAGAAGRLSSVRSKLSTKRWWKTRSLAEDLGVASATEDDLYAAMDWLLYLGVDDDDLPAAQCFNGNSGLTVAPAWRLPHAVRSLTPARAFVRERVALEYGLRLDEVWDLGGRYFPSAGLSPEVVYPMACEVTGRLPGATAPRTLHWLPLQSTLGAPGENVSQHPELRDGHLQVLARRAAHALGLFGNGQV